MKFKSIVLKELKSILQSKVGMFLSTILKL